MFDDFYGLDAKPFQLTPDPAFYFESATHRKALSYLGYGLAQGEGFVVITGEVGAGKSTLVAYLMATIDPAQMTAATIVTSALDGEAIVHVVAQAFGLPVGGHDKASALGAIETFLHDEARAGRRSLLIVDEAQNLSVSALEELRMLSNFQLGAHPLLQTLLLGQPEFRATLQHSDRLEQLRQRVIATHHLAAMQPGEVQEYIEHRLTCVGWQGNPTFDQHVFLEVFEATGGIPRRINRIVNRLLLLGAVDQRNRIDAAMLQQVMADLEHDAANGVPEGTAIGAGSRDDHADEAAPGSFAQLDRPSAAPVAPVYVDGLGPDAVAALIAAALADRDARIDELQAALTELAAAARARDDAAEAEAAAEADGEAARQPDAAVIAALQAQLADAGDHAAALDARLGEQERTLRHTLTMLIEWIETGDGHRTAA